jgi:hypothetical protein
MPNKALGTKAKFEKARIEAEEMLDAAEVHYMCFGEFLFLLICRGRGGLRPPMDVPSTPRKVTVRPDLCRGGLQA